MAVIRVQLNDTELSILEAVLSPVASDPEDIKLLIKIQKALVTVGGKPSVAKSSFSMPTKKPANNAELEELMRKMIEGTLTDSDRERYQQITGMEI